MRYTDRPGDPGIYTYQADHVADVPDEYHRHMILKALNSNFVDETAHEQLMQDYGKLLLNLNNVQNKMRRLEQARKKWKHIPIMDDIYEALQQLDIAFKALEKDL